MLPVKKRTRERLKMIKTRDSQTYDDVINDLIDESLKKPVSKDEEKPVPSDLAE